jgi:hypothetical protein
MTDNFIFRNLGKAKPGSRMHKRGYIVNLAPNAVNKPAAEKPAATPEPPASPDRKKSPGK